jgi:beta-mannosidase
MPEYKESVSRREFLELGVMTVAASGFPQRADGLASQGLARIASSPRRKQIHDLGKLDWKLSSFVPNLELAEKFTDIRTKQDSEITLIPATVPGSVQSALLKAGVIKDWNVGLNAREIEWIENRDWVYQAALPDEWVGSGSKLILRCMGLDYSGDIMLNGKRVLQFNNTFIPCSVDIAPSLKPTGNLLQFRFAPPPRYQGQFGTTSLMKAWKPRYNYYWDWASRMVQTGIWDTVTLEVIQQSSIESLRCVTNLDSSLKQGSLRIFGQVEGPGKLRLSLCREGKVIRTEDVENSTFNDGGVHWLALEPIELWWPNGMGSQPLYDVVAELLDGEGNLIEEQTRRVGFKHIEWRQTDNAPKDADPYLCVVNGKPIFLFGLNWIPVLNNSAETTPGDYSKRLAIYRDSSVNLLRVWGGGILEKESFYDLCDEMGLMLWQEFPLSSSGLDNCPPSDTESIDVLARIAESYIERIQHHASLLVWCGGNELQDDRAGAVSEIPTYTIKKHPVIIRFEEIIKEQDPGHRFLATSPFGPKGSFNSKNTGKGLLWDAHGPWDFAGPADGKWQELWASSDACFHSEMGAPAASSVAFIRKYKGEYKEVPGSNDNPLWNRTPWHIGWPKFVLEMNRKPTDLEEYVAWSQKRQSDALMFAIKSLRAKFPSCGGVIIWMGHDCFPCTSSPSLVDFDGNPKPALMELSRFMRNIPADSHWT